MAWTRSQSLPMNRTAPQRFPLQPWHKSNRVLDRGKNHTHPTRKSRDATWRVKMKANLVAHMLTIQLAKCPRESPIQIRSNSGRVSSSGFYADRVEKLAIMEAVPATPMRSQIQHWHTSIYVVANTEKSHTSISNSLHSTCQRLTPPNIVAATSWQLQTKASLVAFIVALQGWNLHDPCKKRSVGRLPSSLLNIYADRLDLLAIMVAWPKNPCAGEHLVNETHRITSWP